MKRIRKTMSDLSEKENGNLASCENNNAQKSIVKTEPESGKSSDKVGDESQEAAASTTPSIGMTRRRCPWCDRLFLLFEDLCAHAARAHGVSRRATHPKLARLERGFPSARCRLCRAHPSPETEALTLHLAARHSIHHDERGDGGGDDEGVARQREEFFARYYHFVLMAKKSAPVKAAGSEEDDESRASPAKDAAKKKKSAPKDNLAAKIKLEVIERDETRSREKDSPAAAEDESPAPMKLEDHLLVSCPAEGCLEKFTHAAALVGHISSDHKSQCQDILGRAYEANGLIGCRICGVVKRRIHQDILVHCNSKHEGMDKYLSTFGAAAVTRTELETRASRALLDLQCPKCDARGFKGLLRALIHLKKEHGLKNYKDTSELLGLLSGQLGLDKCPQCLWALLPNHRDRHRKFCNGSADDPRPLLRPKDAVGGKPNIMPSVVLRKIDLPPAAPANNNNAVDPSALKSPTRSATKQKEMWSLEKDEAKSGKGSKTKAQEEDKGPERKRSRPRPASKRKAEEVVVDVAKCIKLEPADESDKDDDVVVLDGEFPKITRTVSKQSVASSTTAASTSAASTPNSIPFVVDSRTDTSNPNNVLNVSVESRASAKAASAGKASSSVAGGIVSLGNASSQKGGGGAPNPTVYTGGCLYECPLCKVSGFTSLSLAIAHAKRSHGRDLRTLVSMKRCRVRETVVRCRICGAQVVNDEIEMGFHSWSQHKVPLDVYALMVQR